MQESFFWKKKKKKKERKWPCYEKIVIVNFPYSVCRRGVFNCTSYPCPAVCTVYGDRHYYTFDGLEYDYVSDCQAYLLKVGGLFIHFHVSQGKFLWKCKYFEHQEIIYRNRLRKQVQNWKEESENDILCSAIHGCVLMYLCGLENNRKQCFLSWPCFPHKEWKITLQKLF